MSTQKISITKEKLKIWIKKQFEVIDDYFKTISKAIPLNYSPEISLSDRNKSSDRARKDRKIHTERDKAND